MKNIIEVHDAMKVYESEVILDKLSMNVKEHSM